MIESLLNIVWAATLFLMLVGALLMSWIYRRLRTCHHDTWQRLGEPSLFLNASIKIQHRFSKFLWGREYLALNDPELTRLAGVSQGLAVLVALLIISGFCLVFMTF